LERILERPAARSIQAAPHDVSRRQSNNVNVEDILQQQNSNTLQHFTTIFELGASTKSAHITRPSIDDLNSSALAQIAEYVASTGEILNISDVNEWLKDKPYHQCTTYGNDDEERTNESKSILCMPIVNGQKRVIGVAQLINKVRRWLWLYMGIVHRFFVVKLL
jgi:cGMP-specific 3',5'-cyclic phosphodiesterase, invertebrate